MGWMRGVRARSAIAAVFVVALGLAVAAATFLALLQRELISTVEQSGRARAAEVVRRPRAWLGDISSPASTPRDRAGSHRL